MLKRLSGFFAASAVVTLAACGGSDGGPNFVNAADSATIAELANASGELAGATLNTVFLAGDFSIPIGLASAPARTPTEAARAYADRVSSLLARQSGTALPASPVLQRAAPFSECEPTITGADIDGNPVDTDGDGVPNDYRIDFGSACVSEDSAGTYRVTISGFIRFQDTGTGFFSFKVTAGNLRIVDLDLTTGDTFTVTINGSETFSAAAALATHALTFAYGVTVASGGESLSVTVSVDEDASFDPDDGLTLAMGNPLPAGRFALTADYQVLAGADGNFRMILSTPEPLHYNPDCLSQIDDGIFRGLLNGQSTVGFTATWTTCGEPTVEIFGETVAVAVAAN